MSLISTLAQKLQEIMLIDRRRLSRRLEQLRHATRNGQDIQSELAQLEIAIHKAHAARALRETQRPRITYPKELPISARRNDIAEALNHHQVIIVAGETGSGKTTQLPKICLELGRGVLGLIGCTQPRRIAATSVAIRVARELASEIGDIIGYKVRFAEKINPSAYIKFMTDGILLAETQHDRRLYAYDTLIIDEAHERSLNIDFLLGYIKRLLPRRPELKIIVSSATLDTERFSVYFNHAPIINVAGRTYPVEVYYRPAPEETDPDLAELIADTITEILAHERTGDILVFLPGEREIRDAAIALGKRNLDRILILPLHARLSATEQARVFQRSGLLQIVLATNVAETSLTIPGIRIVIDSGMARINRYSPRSQVSRLRIEPISRASADQRKGRCGRIGPGICVRLYSEIDYRARPEYTDPEIKRTSLAAVILTMKSLNLGTPEDFPFLESPHPRLINEGYQTLYELQALDSNRSLTNLGRQLAQLPIDPRLGRMVIAAATEGALQEVLTIAAALAIQDPRERPLAAQDNADAKHRRFHDPQSDFVAWLNLWEFYLRAQSEFTSKNSLRNFCHDQFLSYNRMQEWIDLRSQLADIATELKFSINTLPASYEALHRSLLTGLLSRIGMLQINHPEKNDTSEKKENKKNYLGARGIQFTIFPGSGLFAKNPRWVVASEIVETTKVYARGTAQIEPEWIELLAQHLVRRNYSDPHWEKRPGRVIALEQVTLFGLPIITQRRVAYGPIDPLASREIFIRSALVQGDYVTKAPFFQHNCALIEEIEEIEHKTRRRDILVDEQIIHAFYDERIPEEIYDQRSFDNWRHEIEPKNPRLLYLDREMLLRTTDINTVNQFPDEINVDGADLALSYRFEPSALDDGVTMTIPLALLARIQDYHHDYLVPGFLTEKITFLLRSLPKNLRTNFIPVADYARAAYENFLDNKNRPPLGLPAALAHFLQRITGIEVRAMDFRLDDLPRHLRMNFRILGENNQILAEDRDLIYLQNHLSVRANDSFRNLAKRHYEREIITAWDFGALPERIEITENGLSISAYPALNIEADNRIALRLFDTLESAAQAHRIGLRQLFSLSCAIQIRNLEKSLGRTPILAYNKFGGVIALNREIIIATLNAVFLDEDTNIRDAEIFNRQLNSGRKLLEPRAEEIRKLTTAILADYHVISNMLEKNPALLPESRIDLQSQLATLIYAGFISTTPLSRLRHYPRYLKAIFLRIEKMSVNPARERERFAEIAPWWKKFQEYLSGNRNADGQLMEIRWMLEEWRVSLFAQELKAAIPVSAQRIEKSWAKIQSK